LTYWRKNENYIGKRNFLHIRYSRGGAAKNKMVKVIQKGEKDLYQCEECGFKYEEREWAEKCQAWCGEHKSCNLEIIEHAVENNGG
jgi:hypothetical protein